MADARILHTPTLPGEVGLFDLNLRLGDLDQRDELGTALLISIFTDRRANPDDRLPVEGESRRGFWGDDFADVQGDLIGSRLWLLSREKQTDQTLARAKEYVDEAVDWLIEDGVANKVDTQVEWVRSGVLGIQIDVFRPSGENYNFRYDYAWQQLQSLEQLTKAEIEAITPPISLATEAGEAITTESGIGLIL